MVLLKPEDKQRLEQMRQQCGQERDLQIKQVENGFIIQAVTRFFVDQGQGPVQAGEINDTTIAVTAYEAGTIAANFMRHGEFWVEEKSLLADDFDKDHPDAWAGEAKSVLDGAHDYIMPEQIAATRARIEKDVEPPHTKPMDAFDRESPDAKETD